MLHNLPSAAIASVSSAFLALTPMVSHQLHVVRLPSDAQLGWPTHRLARFSVKRRRSSCRVTSRL